MSDPVRLNKHLAHTLGISRREADTRIEQGRVLVNGKVATLGNVVQPGRDSITLDQGAVESAGRRYSYVLLNKPLGYVCSRRQQGVSPTIYELLPRQYQKLKVAGRLDKDSCGLVLLTDDGDTIFKLTHPKFGKQKVYTVGLNKPLSAADKRAIQKGVQLEDGMSSLELSDLEKRHTKLANPYKVVMHEGRNRQIRRTFKQLGYTVTHLERTKLGPHSLSELNGKRFLHL